MGNEIPEYGERPLRGRVRGPEFPEERHQVTHRTGFGEFPAHDPSR